MANQDDYRPEFDQRCRQRLAMGKQTYGDGLVNDHDLINDIEEELLDLSNYAYLLYARIQELKAHDTIRVIRGDVREDS